MVYRDSTRKWVILLGILCGVVLLLAPVSGAMAADPAVNITCTTTPDAPTDMEITQTGVASINITWTKGIGANITIVRGSTLGYPFSVFDGDAIYSGNGTWVEVTSIDLDNYTYYYRAWSQNNYGTSTGYDEVSIGSATTTNIDMSALIDYFSDFLEGPMGINSIIFISVLLLIAVWKKGWVRIIMSLGAITWGVFAIDYDIKIAAPLIGIGAFLFFMGVMNRISEAKQAREEM